MASSSNKIKHALALTAAASIFATVGVLHAASHVVGVGKEQGKKTVSNVKELGKNGAGVNPGLSKDAQGLKLGGRGLAADTWSEQGFKGPKEGSVKGPGSPKSAGVLRGNGLASDTWSEQGFKGPKEGSVKGPGSPKSSNAIQGRAQLQNAKDGLKLKGPAGGLRNSGH